MEENGENKEKYRGRSEKGEGSGKEGKEQKMIVETRREEGAEIEEEMY